MKKYIPSMYKKSIFDINYDKLKEFFNSDNHTKFNCATIELKNTFDENGLPIER